MSSYPWYRNRGHSKFRKSLSCVHALFLSICLLFMITSLLNPPHTRAADPKKKLSEIKEKIKSKLQKVKEAKKQEKSISARIEEINRSIIIKEKELKQLDRRISDTQTEITGLSKEIGLLSSKLGNRKDHLKERLRALYKQQYGGNALILVSAKDYQDLVKKSKFISLIAHYDGKVINRYTDNINVVNSKKRDLEVLQGKLEVSKKSARKKKKELQDDRKRKDKLLAVVRSKRSSYEKKIKELEASSRKLQNMIKRLKKKKIPKSVTGKGFRVKQGRLTWPINGKVLIPYGHYKDPEFQIPVFKNGIEIKANKGDRPKAVAGGRIVYADWFQGYGMLLIIDHGSGYHSLYGNLSEIFLNTGDILVKGTEIGKVSNSKVLNVPTLYFEIRYKGKPVDPMTWLQKRKRVSKR